MQTQNHQLIQKCALVLQELGELLFGGKASKTSQGLFQAGFHPRRAFVSALPRLLAWLSAKELFQKNKLSHYCNAVYLKNFLSAIIRMFNLHGLALCRLGSVNMPGLGVRQGMQTKGGFSTGFCLSPGLPRKRAWAPGDVPTLCLEHPHPLGFR